MVKQSRSRWERKAELNRHSGAFYVFFVVLKDTNKKHELFLNVCGLLNCIYLTKHHFEKGARGLQLYNRVPFSACLFHHSLLQDHELLESRG